MKRSFFGTSGIRGIYNSDLTPKLALEVGLALATHTSSGKVTVGHDTRVSSISLEHALVSGVIAGGSRCYRLGLTPTPILSFLTKEIKANTGVMITASHNPPEYNGIKIFDGDGLAYNEEQQSRIEEIVGQKSFIRAPWQRVGEETSVEKFNLYFEACQKTVKLGKRWRIVVDLGCGATCNFAPKLLRMFGCEVTAINAQPDGFFPGREPSFEEKNLQEIGRIVRELKADVGFVYDGDGDRVAAINEKGESAPFDQVLASFAAYYVRKNDGGKVVTNVDASMCLEETVGSFGGEVIRTKVGDVHVANTVKHSNAVFGGEPCGAWIHPNFHYCPDGLLSSVLLLRALEETEKKLSNFISKKLTYPIIRKKIAFRSPYRPIIMKRVKSNFHEFFPGVKRISTIDGIRLTVKDGWILIRPSGTEPCMRITAEAKSIQKAREIMKIGEKFVKKTIRDATK